jgi:hypothetical protein
MASAPASPNNCRERLGFEEGSKTNNSKELDRYLSD